MSQVSLDEAQVKELLKQAILELFQQRRDLLHELFMDVLGDLALVNAIGAGEAGETVSKTKIFEILGSLA
jgi:hypothetical protein